MAAWKQRPAPSSPVQSSRAAPLSTATRRAIGPPLVGMQHVARATACTDATTETTAGLSVHPAVSGEGRGPVGQAACAAGSTERGSSNAAIYTRRSRAASKTARSGPSGPWGPTLPPLPRCIAAGASSATAKKDESKSTTPRQDKISRILIKLRKY